MGKGRAKSKEPKAPVPPASPWVAALESRPWLYPVGLAVLAVALYARTLGYGLVEFDDDVYLADPRLAGFDGLVRIFSEPYFANYHPLTTLTYALDRALWGERLWGFRLTHVLLYAAGVALVYALLRRLVSRQGWAAAGAALFAAHAVHVEVVAWLAQRKDLVCLVFYVAAIIAHVRLRETESERGRWLVASSLLGAAAMLAKGYAVILPGVLLAYDVCFLHRVRFRHLAEKIPLVFAAAVITVVTVSSQEQVHATEVSTIEGLARVSLVGKVFLAYLGKTVLPLGLSALYLVSPQWLPGPAALLGWLLAAGAVAAFAYYRRRRPALAFGLALYLLPLATVLNLFFTLKIWIADRYLFLPTVGFVVIAAVVVEEAAARAATQSRVRWALGAIAVLAVHVGLTVARVPAWAGAVELWSAALRQHDGMSGSGPVTAAEVDEVRRRGQRPNNKLVALLAQAYGRRGDDAQARGLLAETQVVRGTELAHAKAAFDRGDLEQALTLAHKVAERREWDAAMAWELIGLVHATREEYAAARDAYRRVIDLAAKDGRAAPNTLRDLGLVELRLGQPQAALGWYRQALVADPNDSDAMVAMAVTHEQLGELAEARRWYEEVLRRAPEHRDAPGIRKTLARLQEKAP